jgi:hypothetical protein
VVSQEAALLAGNGRDYYPAWLLDRRTAQSPVLVAIAYLLATQVIGFLNRVVPPRVPKSPWQSQFMPVLLLQVVGLHLAATLAGIGWRKLFDIQARLCPFDLSYAQHAPS